MSGPEPSRDLNVSKSSEHPASKAPIKATRKIDIGRDHTTVRRDHD